MQSTKQSKWHVIAPSKGHFEEVKLLVELEADTNVCGTTVNPQHEWAQYTLLIAATSSGHIEVERFLLQHGAEVNKRSYGSASIGTLSMGSRKAHLEVVKLLIANGANINEPDNPYDGHSCFTGRSERITTHL